VASSSRPTRGPRSVFPSFIALTVVLQILLTAYSGVIYLGAGTTVIGAGDAATLGLVGLSIALVYTLAAVQTSRRRWPSITAVAAAIASAVWLIVLAQKYGISNRVLAGIGAALAAIVSISTFGRRDTRTSLWRVR